MYMAADNDLAQYADSDLVEMMEVGSSDDVAIIVQIDKPGIGARRLFVSKDTTYSLGDMGIIDMCDWHTLFEFLDWGIRSYEASKYFIILWDHGTGWTSMPGRSFGTDWSSGNELSISNGDFQRAISAVYNSTGKKINLLAFDACLMQQIEAGFEIKDFAKIFLAPQTFWPLNGFPYDEILEEVTANPGINEVEFAKKVVEISCNNYVNIVPVVISAINLEELNKLGNCVINLFNELMVNSPNQALINLRKSVQTIPLVGYTPHPEDDYVDFGDFIKGLNNLMGNEKTQKLVEAYNKTIIVAKYLGDAFSKITGITIWFPDVYLQFKQLVDYYNNLDWTESKWQNFLNWFYNEDDIRPTNTNIYVNKLGENNDFHLAWNKSFDLASVFYHVIEANDTLLIFGDGCEDSSLWNFNGFVLTGQHFHSGQHSFFSGNGSNLLNSIETKEPMVIGTLGILSLYLSYNTEEMADSLIIEYGTFKDVYYGRNEGWVNRRIILPSGNYPLQIKYHTNASSNLGGCYIDDIKISMLVNGRYARQYLIDTTLYIFNKVRGDYLYAVLPQDKYGNKGNSSHFTRVSITNFAVPYSNPNPFQKECDIVLDYPDSLHPSVIIFSCSGRKIKKFPFGVIQNKKIHWNGKDEANQDVGAGLYFILLKDGSFKKIGKIARQR